MSIQINLSLKQIYEVLCPKCQKRVLDLASEEGAKEAVRDSLKRQLEGDGPTPSPQKEKV